MTCRKQLMAVNMIAQRRAFRRLPYVGLMAQMLAYA